MQDPKFEKQVQQKMEELSFSPSDAVWLKVDAEINRKRKRRGVFIWLLFLAGVFMATALYIVSITGKSRLTDTSRSLTTLPKEKNAPDSLPYEKPTVSEPSASINPGHSSQLPVTSNSIKNNGSAIRSGNYILSYHKQKILTQPRNGTNPRKYEKASSNLPPTVTAENSDSISSPPITENSKTTEEKKEPGTVKSITPDSTAQSGLPSSNEVSRIQKSEKKKNTAKWRIGFTTGAGISSVRQSLFKNTHVGNNALGLFPASGGMVGPAAYYPSSEIQPGLSFQGGFFLKRLLAKKISFTAGLNYHLYTTRVTTGALSDSIIYVAYSNAVAIAVNGAYRSGAAAIHTSHYHFLEMPLTLGLPFYDNKKLTLTWEAGGSLSYLLYSDALQFDSYTGLYYKNEAAFNRIQVNAATAVLAGFPGGRFDWQIGPQVEYGLTGLLNKNMAHSEHLLYLGLKFSILFGKK